MTVANPAAEAATTATTTQTPPDQADYAARMASRTGQVPAKFIVDGKVDVAALAQSYRELEKAQSTRTPAAPAQTATPPVADAAAASAATIDEMLEAPATPVITWDAVNTEIATTGKLSDASLAAVKKQFNATDEMVNDMIAGAKARSAVSTAQAAAIVGGVQQLQDTLNWAKTNMQPAELAALKVAMKSPGMKLALMGVHAMRQAAAAAKPPAPKNEPTTIMANGESPNAGAAGVKPFESKAELTAAMRNPKYRTDPDYRREVEDRTRATTYLAGRRVNTQNQSRSGG